MRHTCLPLIILAVALSGCSGAGKVSRLEEVRQAVPARIAPGDAITIVGLTGVEDDTLDRIDSELRAALRDTRVIRPKEFRDGMFPWFEPDLAPTDTASLTRLMLQPKVKQRIDELRIRYIVTIGGGTYVTGSGGGTFYLWIVVAQTEKTELTAGILDTRLLRAVGQIEAVTTGGAGGGLIAFVPVPLAYSFSSMTAACKAIAERVAAYVTGKPQPPPVGGAHSD